MIKQILTYVAPALLGALVTWISAKLLSPREKFKQEIDYKLSIQSALIEQLSNEVSKCRSYISILETKVSKLDLVYSCKHVASCPLIKYIKTK